jgi:MFS family permease
LKILGYIAALMFTMAFSDPTNGLLDVPISFLLKNKLSLDAEQVSQFRLIVSIPLFLSVLFGLARDSFGDALGGDRAIIFWSAVISAFVYLACGLHPFTYPSLIIAIVITTSCALFTASAQNGLSATLGQRHAMCGQMSSVWNMFTAAPAAIAYIAGGFISDFLKALNPDHATKILFFAGSVASIALALVARLGPKSVYEEVRGEAAAPRSPWADAARFLRGKTVYLPLIIWFLWNFSPATGTPLQFELQNRFGGQDWQWGAWNAAYTVSFMPAYLLFAWLCQRVSLDKLLFWGTVIAIPQYAPLLLARSAEGAIWAAVPIGLFGGVATCAYVDLIMRSCPQGLQGTTLMVASGVYFASVRGGDLLGSYLYAHNDGLAPVVAASSLSSALILPLLHFVRAPDSDEGLS